MYKERRDLLPWYVKLYIYLRRNIINPILLLNDRNRIKNMNLEASKGEVSIKSSIEQAIINDLKQEFASGEKTTFQVETHIKPKKMLLNSLPMRLLQENTLVIAIADQRQHYKKNSFVVYKEF